MTFKKFKLIKSLLLYAIIFSNIILPSLFIKKSLLFQNGTTWYFFVIINWLISLQHFTFHFVCHVRIFFSRIKISFCILQQYSYQCLLFFLVNSCFVFLIENWPVFLWKLQLFFSRRPNLWDCFCFSAVVVI